MAVTYSGDAATTRTNLGLGSLATKSSVGAAEITDNSVGAAELNVSGNGTAGYALTSDGDGSFSWTELGGGGAGSGAGGGGLYISSFNSAGTLQSNVTITTGKMAYILFGHFSSQIGNWAGNDPRWGVEVSIDSGATWHNTTLKCHKGGYTNPYTTLNAYPFYFLGGFGFEGSSDNQVANNSICQAFGTATAASTGTKNIQIRTSNINGSWNYNHLRIGGGFWEID